MIGGEKCGPRGCRGRDWIIPTALIVAGAVGYGVYSEWAGPRFEAGLRRTEADMKSNLPLRVDQNTTLVDVKVRENSQHLLVRMLTGSRGGARLKSISNQPKAYDLDE